MSTPVEISALTKAGDADETHNARSRWVALHSDGSACVMSRGEVRGACGSTISRRPPDMLHQPRFQRSDRARRAARRRWPTRCRSRPSKRSKKPERRGRPRDDRAHRGDHIAPAEGWAPCFGARRHRHQGHAGDGGRSASSRIWAASGRPWPVSCPELASTGRVVRRSTTTGITRADTGEALPGSNGRHIFLLACDGADVERFLRTLHDRCWLGSFGWMMVGAGEPCCSSARSLIAWCSRPGGWCSRVRPSSSPPPSKTRRAGKLEAIEGAPLDMVSACPPLRVVGQARLAELRAQDAHRLAPDRAKAREAFITRQAARVAKRTGVAPEAARHIVEEHVNAAAFLLPGG